MVLAAIPARYDSTRFPGKPIAPILGRPMVAWVVDAARCARSVDEVVVVTDHEAIASAARLAGARAVVIQRPAASGSDRIGQLLDEDESAARAKIVVNLQADEPLLEPEAIDRTVEALRDDPAADIVTLVRRFRDDEDPGDPDRVKAVLTGDGMAADFSRFAPPEDNGQWLHIGLYTYRREAFDRFVVEPPSPREEAERLEQLRAMELGLRIRCVEFDSRAIGVDAPADVARVEAVLEDA